LVWFGLVSHMGLRGFILCVYCDDNSTLNPPTPSPPPHSQSSTSPTPTNHPISAPGAAQPPSLMPCTCSATRTPLTAPCHTPVGGGGVVGVIRTRVRVGGLRVGAGRRRSAQTRRVVDEEDQGAIYPATSTVPNPRRQPYNHPPPQHPKSPHLHKRNLLEGGGALPLHLLMEREEDSQHGLVRCVALLVEGVVDGSLVVINAVSLTTISTRDQTPPTVMTTTATAAAPPLSAKAHLHV